MGPSEFLHTAQIKFNICTYTIIRIARTFVGIFYF